MDRLKIIECLANNTEYSIDLDMLLKNESQELCQILKRKNSQQIKAYFDNRDTWPNYDTVHAMSH